MANTFLAEQVNRVTRTLTEDIKNNRLDIPSPPHILQELRQLSKDDSTSTNDIANIIKQDANITARLIKVSNCALFASRFPVSTIDSAVKRLGHKRVQSLVTGLVIAQQLLKTKN
jgi:HD-like signal output (HDOD) protein